MYSLLVFKIVILNIRAIAFRHILALLLGLLLSTNYKKYYDPYRILIILQIRYKLFFLFLFL